MTSQRANKDAGRLYDDMVEGMPEDRLRAKKLRHTFNLTSPTETEKRVQLCRELFATFGPSSWIEPPMHICYGKHTFIGKHVYANMNCTFVDDGVIHIEDHVMLGANVCLITVGHPVDSRLRQSEAQYTFPITIQRGAWLACNVVVLPGVTIGENTVIGAGSVVTKSIPSNVVAFGNPCRAVRDITDRDRTFYYKQFTVEPSSKYYPLCKL